MNNLLSYCGCQNKCFWQRFTCKASIRNIPDTSSANSEAQEIEQKDSLLESARKRKLSEEAPNLQIIQEVADKNQANSIPSNVNFLQEALKEEAKLSVENQIVIDSIEPNVNKIDKVNSEEREVVSDYVKDAMKIQGGAYVFGWFLKVGVATPTKFSMLFKHNYGKLSWKFGDHSLNFSFVHGPSWLRILESIHRYSYGHQIFRNFCHKYA